MQGTFADEAGQALRGMGSSIRGALAALPGGGVRKAADLKRVLGVDYTLCWQVMTVANAKEPLKVAPQVPGTASMQKFLEAVEKQGAPAQVIESVAKAHQNYEAVVERHAGDRVSFNSMVAAVSGDEEEDDAVDAGHRRAVFRGLSHFMGIQAKARVLCKVLTEAEDGGSWEGAILSGHIGLRMLKPRKRVSLFYCEKTEVAYNRQMRFEPIAERGEGGNGYLLNAFSTDLSTDVSGVSSGVSPGDSSGAGAKLRVQETERVVRVSWENPDVGNLGATTKMFGMVVRNHPGYPEDGEERPVDTVDVGIGKPVELLVVDLLVKPGLFRGAKGQVGVYLGATESFVPRGPMPDSVVQVGKLSEVERLGVGPGVMAIGEVPGYVEMVKAVGARLKRDLSGYEAWRVRVEYPLYESTVRVEWG